MPKTSEEKRQYFADYHAKHRERINARKRTHHAAHRDRDNAKSHAYHAAHRAQANTNRRAYYAAHREQAIATARAYREAHRDQVKTANQAWRAAHPDQAKALGHKKRACKRKAAIVDMTAAQWHEIQAAYEHRCVYCGKRAKGHLTQDHLTPLSKGGNHTAANIVPACGSCNSRKRTGPPLSPVQPLLLTIAAPKKERKKK